MKIKICVAFLLTIALISLVPVSESSRVTVTYPPNTENLNIESGQTEEVEVHLYNKNDSTLKANLVPSSLDNIFLSFENTISLPPDSKKEVFLEITPEKEGTFSGVVHVEFLELVNDFSNETGGNLIAGSSIPLGGKVLRESQKNSKSYNYHIYLVVGLVLSLLIGFVLYRKGNRDNGSKL